MENEQPMPEQNLNLFQILKLVYSKNQYLFLAINVVCLYVIFFLFEESKGGFGFKTAVFLFGILLGGYIGKYIVSQSSKENDVLVTGFRKGAAICLILVTFSAYSKKVDSIPSSSSTTEQSDSQESSSEVCPHCNGSGERVNNVSGVYGMCSSCQGKGIVSSDNDLAE